jgi:hypothetical protein
LAKSQKKKCKEKLQRKCWAEKRKKKKEEEEEGAEKKERSKFKRDLGPVR